VIKAQLYQKFIDMPLEASSPSEDVKSFNASSDRLKADLDQATALAENICK
jgi:hypothetical protein